MRYADEYEVEYVNLWGRTTVERFDDRESAMKRAQALDATPVPALRDSVKLIVLSRTQIDFK